MLQEEVHNFSVLMLVFRVILSIRTGFCFGLQTQDLGAGKHTNHGHNGIGGEAIGGMDGSGFQYCSLYCVLSSSCPFLENECI